MQWSRTDIYLSYKWSIWFILEMTMSTYTIAVWIVIKLCFNLFATICNPLDHKSSETPYRLISYLLISKAYKMTVLSLFGKWKMVYFWLIKRLVVSFFTACLRSLTWNFLSKLCIQLFVSISKHRRWRDPI